MFLLRIFIYIIVITELEECTHDTMPIVQYQKVIPAYNRMYIILTIEVCTLLINNQVLKIAVRISSRKGRKYDESMTNV